MSDTPAIGPNGREDEVTRELRAIYAPPASAEYWERLESRILARVFGAGDEEGWWTPFGGWIRVGLLAACLSALAAAMGLAWANESAARAAYVTVVETPRAYPSQLTAGQTATARDATLRYLISH
jgi:hypothetical protein